MGGGVLRRTRKDTLEPKVEIDIRTLRAEVDELGSECRRANDKTKITLQAKMNWARAKLEAWLDEIHAPLEASKGP